MKTTSSSNALTPEQYGLAHFLRLAQRGRGTGASGGERRAAKLAAVIAEHCPGLDDEAIAGAACFMRLASGHPSVVNAFMEGQLKAADFERV